MSNARWWIVLIAFLVGCQKPGPEIVPVFGSVMLDGRPLREGSISFVSATGYVSSAPIDGDGHFQLVSQFGPGIPRGSYQVTVLPAARSPDEMSMQAATEIRSTTIPGRYQYPATSGLRATVDVGSGEFAFELTTAN